MRPHVVVLGVALALLTTPLAGVALAGFTEVAEFGTGATIPLAWGDCDGDLDLAAGNEHTPTQNYLYINNENDSDYLMIHLVGHHHDLGTPYSNRDGVGAKVTVYELGYLGDPTHILGHREISAHGGFAAQNAIDAHFGVPSATAVDLRIVWPGSGGSHIVQDAQDVPVGQRITVHEGVLASVGQTVEPFSIIVSACEPNPFSGVTRVALDVSSGAHMIAQVFDVSGRFVAQIMNGPVAGGRHVIQWDGRDAAGSRLPSGIYFWLITAGDQVATRKVVMVR